MKAVAFDRDHSTTLLLPPEVMVFPDSALTQPGHPVFLPDFDKEWLMEFYLAARISRLGKNIAPKFSSRYYDAVTVAARLVPATVAGQLSAERRWPGICGMFDSSLTPGRWLPEGEIGQNAEVTDGDSTVVLTSFRTEIAQAISAISRYATLKTGDIVMPCRVLPVPAVRQGSIFNISFAGNTVLPIKVR